MSKVTLTKEGQPRISIEVEGGITVANLVALAGSQYGTDGMAVFVNGEEATTDDTVVPENARVNVTRAAKGNA